MKSAGARKNAENNAHCVAWRTYCYYSARPNQFLRSNRLFWYREWYVRNQWISYFVNIVREGFKHTISLNIHSFVRSIPEGVLRME